MSLMKNNLLIPQAIITYLQAKEMLSEWFHTDQIRRNYHGRRVVCAVVIWWRFACLLIIQKH